MTRQEHLECAKKRALELANRGELLEAVASLLADLERHPELKRHPNMAAGMGHFLFAKWQSPRDVSNWIETFH